jgi:hypothetical protein
VDYSRYFRLRFTYRMTARMRITAAMMLTTRSRRLVSMLGADAEVEDSDVDVIVEVEL